MARNYKRDRKGRFAKVNSLAGKKVRADARPAVVPYARASLRSQSVGVNGGINVSPNVRISAGGYVRIQRRSQSGLEKKLKSAERKMTVGVSEKVTKNKNVQPLIAQGIRKARQQAVNKVLGGQKRIGKSDAFGRLTTSQSGMPSISVRKGKSRVPQSKRRSAINDYNAAMARSLKGNRVKKSRPQRRKKAA